MVKTQHTQNENVVQLANWKKKSTKIKDNCIIVCLSFLSFSELVDESNLIIDQLKSNRLDENLLSASVLILNEFNKRLELDNFSSVT
ncbi:MAG: hypothetical protein ISR65_06575 [Bacteriovoracaceae bacterium]|nr:hypothetical protein [Bacteriovoracaceae bacterium]